MMQYRYAKNRNFEDYASGRVFYARPGQPAFPARLASEIFQRALGQLQAGGSCGPITIYDPVCGCGYWLVVLAYLHWDAIAAIYASDIDAEVLSLAERNLSLISPMGLDQRIDELKAMILAYQKESHTGALTGAKKFGEQLDINLRSHAIRSTIFQADSSNSQSMARGLNNEQVDLVLADVPYGWHSEWRGGNFEGSVGKRDLRTDQTSIWQMLEALHPLLKQRGVLAVAADKSQKVKHEKFHRLERFQVGKRRIFILQISK